LVVPITSVVVSGREGVARTALRTRNRAIQGALFYFNGPR